MEIAWYLTGLACCHLAGYSDLEYLDQQIANARILLEKNCGPSGAYRHLGRAQSAAGFLRGRIGSFADQVYPTIAFSYLSRAINDQSSRDLALRTAKLMCERQAENGEWCWHYDSESGNVVSRYPIYSVHQHAMGPMMLFAASEATGVDFGGPIMKGLAWIGGKNELGLNLIEPELNLVWRCIYLDSASKYSDALFRFLKMRSGPASPRQLKIRYECRPYELGWLLYAFSGR